MKTTGCLVLLFCSWMTLVSAAGQLSRQIFRDDVEQMKGYGGARPVEYDQDQIYLNKYQDDYDPIYEEKYKPYTNQNEYKPNYQDDYRPTYEDDYKPNNHDEYGPNYQDDYKPNKYQDGYKPTYQDYKPNYQDDYKPNYQDDYKPSYQDDYKPSYEDNYKPAYQKPSKPAYGNQYQQEKPYEPAYKPAPKPYKPRPEYPKEVILLTPSPALKASSYTKEYVTKDYHAGAVPGTAGKDYPNYTAVPTTSFDCLNVKQTDYSYMFADREAGCQVFHSCHADGRQDSFLCPKGTIFDTETQTCDWWFNARCI